MPCGFHWLPCWLWAGVLPGEKRQCLRWRPGWRYQEGSIRDFLLLLTKMGQDLVDDVLVLDASDDFDRSAAAAADFDFCIEYSLESLSPSHSGMALGGGASFCVGDRLDAFPTLRWCDQPTTAVVRCQDAMVAQGALYPEDALPGWNDPGGFRSGRPSAGGFHRTVGSAGPQAPRQSNPLSWGTRSKSSLARAGYAGKARQRREAPPQQGSSFTC